MNRAQSISVILGLALVVVLYVLPTGPGKKGLGKTDPTDTRIEEALRKVQSGENPMEGVMMLREILEEDPENLDATYALGMLSMQSKQYEKAVDRFKRVLELDKQRVEVWNLMAQAYEAMGEEIKAITAYRQFVAQTDDVKAKSEVEQRLKQLENN